MIEAIKMITRMIHIPESNKKAENIKSIKKTKKKKTVQINWDLYYDILFCKFKFFS